MTTKERELIKERAESAFNEVTTKEKECAMMLYVNNDFEKVTTDTYYTFMNNFVLFQKMLSRWVELNDLCILLGIEYDKTNYGELSDWIINY